MSILDIKLPDNEEVDNAVSQLCAAISKQAVVEMDNESVQSDMYKDTMPSPKSANRTPRTDQNGEISTAVSQLNDALTKEKFQLKNGDNDEEDKRFNEAVSQLNAALSQQALDETASQLCAYISKQAVFEMDNDSTQQGQSTEVSFGSATVSPKEENKPPQAENLQNQRSISPHVNTAKVVTCTSVLETEQPVMNASPDLIEVKQSRFHRLFRGRKQSDRKSSLWRRLRLLCCCGKQEE